MKALELERMEQVEGGSCTAAVLLAIGTGFAIAAGPVGWKAMAAAAFLGAGNGYNVGDQCFK